MHDLGNLLINNLEWKVFFMWVICCPDVEWVSKSWGVTFLMVPPKDKFALIYLPTYFPKFNH